MITIFSDIISKRLSYVLAIVFEDREIEYTVVNDPEAFLSAELPRVAYSDYPFDDIECQISPADLLFEEDIRYQALDKSSWNEEEVLAFQGIADPLASIFYLITRYEEYVTDKVDEHDRFSAKYSFLHKFGWHRKLMVERWCEKIITMIEQCNEIRIDHKSLPFRIVPSFDIDNAYAYRLKTGTRKLLSISRDIVKLDKERLSERKYVLNQGGKDPYDTYNFIEELVERGFPVKIFWLVGDYATYDRNVAADNEEHQELIRRMAAKCEVGLHPSYQSNTSRSILEKEKLRLQEIIDAEIDMSRQHFLKLKLPYTYESLLKTGIVNDYTMGFAEIPGFRAGIARPFQWYNLRKDMMTELSVHPFTYMDGTLLEYMHLSIDEAKKEIDLLKSEVKRFGGDMIMIWHNETIGDYRKWNGWRAVLEHALSE